MLIIDKNGLWKFVNWNADLIRTYDCHYKILFIRCPVSNIYQDYSSLFYAGKGEGRRGLFPKFHTTLQMGWVGSPSSLIQT